MRFLIKAHKFLEAQPFAKYSKDSEYGDDNVLAEIYTGYKKRLFHHIRGILIWLLRANVDGLTELEQLLPSSIVGRLWSRKPCPPGRTLTITKREAAVQACHFTMSIWYALKYCPEAAIPVLKDKTLCRQLGELNSVCKSEESGLEAALAQWHHFDCLKQISDHLKITDPEFFSELNLNMDEMLKSLKKWQDRVMRSIGPSRRPRTHTYSMTDEIEDRLALLSKELHSDNIHNSLDVANDCVRYVRQRMELRENTTKINTGGKEWTDSSQDNKKSKSAPWEMTCLNHHTFLKILPTDAEDHEIDASKKDCLEFLCSDLTFISSWNERDYDMISRWWDMDTSAVVCSTLIDLQLQGILSSSVERYLLI